MAVYQYDSQANRIKRTADLNSGLQAFANFIQQGRQNNQQAQYQNNSLDIQRQELAQNAPYKNAMAQQAMAQAALYNQRAANTGVNNISQDDQIVVGQYANGQPIIKSKSAMEQIAKMQNNVKKQQRIEAIKTRKLTGEENKAIGYANSLNKDLDYMKGKIGSNDELFSYAPFGAFQEGAQSFKDSLQAVSNVLLYLRSGAQINEQEYRRLRKNLPSLTGRAEVDKRKIERFQAEFNGIKDRIKYGTLSPEYRALMDGDTTSSGESSYSSLWS